MKYKQFIPIFLFLFFIQIQLIAQPNTWVGIPNYPGASELYMVSFGIGNDIYAGTGTISTSPYMAVDIWQFDFTSNSWSSKADYAGNPKRNATAFTVNGIGFITGGDYNDMWGFDPNSNSWTQEANFPGGNRVDPISFSIGDKGYFGLGYGILYKDDFWEYDSNSNSWSQKATFTGTAREQAAGFSVAGFGFVGCGYDGSQIKKDFWKYDPSNDSWSQVSDIPGPERYYPASFTINNSAFVVGGENGNQILKDCWQYNPYTDSWIQKANYPGMGISNAIGSSANGLGFVGNGNTGGGNTRLCYKYIPDQSVNIVNPNEKSISLICNNDHSTFTLIGINHNNKMEIFDLSGQSTIKYYFNREQESFNFSILIPGIYFIVISGENKIADSIFKISVL